MGNAHLTSFFVGEELLRLLESVSHLVLNPVHAHFRALQGRTECASEDAISLDTRAVSAGAWNRLALLFALLRFINAPENVACIVYGLGGGCSRWCLLSTVEESLSIPLEGLLLDNVVVAALHVCTEELIVVFRRDGL